jgi:BlaI family transcriptional regulator, penicillinase repressor
MDKPQFQRLGELQLRILKILWDQREATVADVHDQLASQSDLAYTTIATMLRKMEARGLVTHRTDGRTFIYQPAVAEADVTRGLADHLIDRLFEGSLAGMVSHLLTTRDVSPDELAQIERLILQQKKKT